MLYWCEVKYFVVNRCFVSNKFNQGEPEIIAIKQMIIMQLGGRGTPPLWERTSLPAYMGEAGALLSIFSAFSTKKNSALLTFQHSREKPLCWRMFRYECSAGSDIFINEQIF